MKLVFCGTPEFAVPTLNAVLAAGHEVALVLTQPDRAVGRGQTMQLPPVKRFALERGIPVVQPEKLKNNPELRAQLQGIAPEAILIVAYGRIIPQWMLDLPPLGNINLHGSLLPKYRGAAPIQWALAEGEKVTGVTTMRIDAGLDTGDMLLAKAVPIGPEETSVDLFDSLAEIGAELMVETLRGLTEASIVPQVQDHVLATLAPLLKREDGMMDFSRSAQVNYDRWRGFQPWPGAYTTLGRKKLIVHRMSLSDETAAGEPGELRMRGASDGTSDRTMELLVICDGGSMLALTEVQMEGKRRMSAAEFLRGNPIGSGARLGL